MKKYIVAIILLFGVVTQSCVTTRYPFAKSKECAKTFDKIHKLIHKDKDIAGRTVYYVERMDSLAFTKLILESNDCFTGILYEEAAKVFDKELKPEYKYYNFKFCFDTLYKTINTMSFTYETDYGLIVAIPIGGMINKYVRNIDLMLIKEKEAKYGIRFR